MNGDVWDLLMDNRQMTEPIRQQYLNSMGVKRSVSQLQEVLPPKKKASFFSATKSQEWIDTWKAMLANGINQNMMQNTTVTEITAILGLSNTQIVEEVLRTEGTLLDATTKDEKSKQTKHLKKSKKKTWQKPRVGNGRIVRMDGQ